MIQTSKFNLQTPVADSNGNLITYWPGNFPSNQYHSVLGNGNLSLFASTLGDTSENSNRTRTEFREIIEGTQNLRNWKYGDYAHQFLRAAFTLSQVTPNGKVVVGQIHVKDNNRPPLKLLWDNGKVRVKFRPTYNQELDVNYTLVEGLALTTRINYSVHVVDDGHVSINLSAGGVAVTPLVLELDTTFADKLLYFKAGLYNQEDPDPLIHTATDGTAGVFDKLETDRY